MANESFVRKLPIVIKLYQLYRLYWATGVGLKVRIVLLWGLRMQWLDCLKTSERIRDHKMVKCFQLGSVIPCKINYRCQVQPSSADLPAMPSAT